MEIGHTASGDAEPFSRATGIAMNWGGLTLCALIAIVEFFTHQNLLTPKQDARWRDQHYVRFHVRG
jgi:hypothetical protein